MTGKLLPRLGLVAALAAALIAAAIEVGRNGDDETKLEQLLAAPALSTCTAKR